MRKSILETYALAVCFFTVGCFAITLGIGLYDLVQINNPEFTLDSEQFNRHQTNETFWESSPSYPPYVPTTDDSGKAVERPSEEKLTQMRTESFERALKIEQRSGGQGLLKILIILLIDAVVFYVHWQIAKRARNESNA